MPFIAYATICPMGVMSCEQRPRPHFLDFSGYTEILQLIIECHKFNLKSYYEYIGANSVWRLHKRMECAVRILVGANAQLIYIYIICVPYTSQYYKDYPIYCSTHCIYLVIEWKSFRKSSSPHKCLVRTNRKSSLIVEYTSV